MALPIHSSPRVAPTGEFGKLPGLNGLGADPNSSEGLLELANMQGGAIAEAANELAHPTLGLLSTVGNSLKKGFQEFIDVISVPNQAVAAAISSKYTLSDTVKKNISASDVLFGEWDPEASTMKKVGGFITRTATDILLDPLTYLTFGYSGVGKLGIMGLGAVQKISIGSVDAAKIIEQTTKAGGVVKQLEKEGLATVALNDKGFDVFKFLKGAENQKKGLATLKVLEATTDTQKLAKAELDDVMGRLFDETMDAPLDPDFAKMAMRNLLEKHPQLSAEIIDAGGVKFFGKQILSAQRMGYAMHLIPGMTLIDNVTSPIRQSVNALFDPAMMKTNEGLWARMPEEYVQAETAMRDLATSMKDQRIGNLMNIIKANGLTAKDGELLRHAIEHNLPPADAKLLNAYKQMQNFSDEDWKFLNEAGILKARRDHFVPHVFVDGPKVKTSPWALPPTDKPSAPFERKAGETWEEAKANGFEFDPNVFSAWATRTVENTRAYAGAQFMKSMVKTFGKMADEPGAEGYVPINLSGIKRAGHALDAELGQQFNQYVFHPVVAKRMSEAVTGLINDEATKDFFKAYDKVQGLWKASVTSMFPMFHGRNAIGNVFLHMMDLGLHSLNPILHGSAASMVAIDRKVGRLEEVAYGIGEAADKAKEELHDLLGKKVFTDATGTEWSFGELRETMRRKNIAFTHGNIGPLDIDPEERLGKLFPEQESKTKRMLRKTVPLTQDFKGFEIGRDVGTLIEEQARVLDFMANLKATGDPTLAAMRTKMFLFDYKNLTAFEKNVMRRLLPFYTFTRKNLEAQVRTLMTTPGRTALQVHGIQNLGDALSGAELTDEEKDALPDWIKSGAMILRKKNGESVEVIGSLGTPLEQPFSQFQPNILLGSVSPLLRVPVEQMSGYSFFQGKMLSDVTNAASYKSAPKAIKDFIGYTEVKGKKNGKDFTFYVSLRPERMNLVNNLPPTSRVLSTIKQVTNEDVSGSIRAWQQITGIRPYSFDLEQEAAKRERELKTKLETLLNKAGVTATFKRTFIPKEDKLETL